MKNIYFLSDAHLGSLAIPHQRMQERRLVRFLDSIKEKAAAVYLLGDMFDFWYEYKYVVPKGFTRFLGKISELTDMGVEVHYFTGNHDIWAYEYLEKECGVILHKQPLTVFLTTNLAAAAGGVATMFLTMIKYGKPSLSLTLNGVLAGLVGITAGCDLVSPFGAVIIGLVCGLVLVYAIEFIDHVLHIDDPVGASSVHGVCGILGTLMTGLLSTSNGAFYGYGWGFFGAECFGILVIDLWAAACGFILFYGIKYIHGLRVNKRIEEEGLDIYEHGEACYN